MKFTRGLDPKEAMGIGRQAILNEIGGKIINSQEYKKWKKERSCSNNVVIVVTKKGKYEIVKNLIGGGRSTDTHFGFEKDLYEVLLKLQERFRKHGVDVFHFPNMRTVSAKTIGLDLVSVQPMSAPTPTILYLDYCYAAKTNNK